MKRIISECQLTPVERERADALARALGITATTAEILFARGFCTEEAMRTFLHPSQAQLLSPLVMRGMQEAHDLIQQARDEGWSVAIFGDYDADGIGASSILCRALRAYGIEPYVYVPERKEGYGLTIPALDRVFDECMPELIITVDCGISCAQEVEYIKKQGAYVIVTDHHELPEVLPDCICINPKLQDDYPYDNLCGAGVALKLAVCLLGERAYEWMDICAMSTVADSVPLTGENRIIVYEGLRRINAAPRPAFRALLGKTEGVTAQTLAFTIAPRINAAGRMGDAHAALRLMLSEDEEEIMQLAQLLNRYNAERQKLCDELCEMAQVAIKGRGAYGNVVMAAGERWHEGLVGIAAARIADQFARPTLLFVRKGDMLRGSARSIENVNIFEALKSCSALLEGFGGHAQAAGMRLKAENFERLQQALDEYIGSHYGEEDFVPTVTVSGEYGQEPAEVLAAEMELFEPCGVGNRRPLFVMHAGALHAFPMKPQSPHVSITGKGLDFISFGGIRDLRILRSDIPKDIIFEYDLSHFKGREYIKGLVRGVVYDGSAGDTALDCMENTLRACRRPQRVRARLLSAEETDRLIAERRAASRYGLCVVTYDRANIARFPALAGMGTDVFAPSACSGENALILAPETGSDLSVYRDIVFLEQSPAIGVMTGRAEVYACDAYSALFVPHTREELIGVFVALRRAAPLRGDDDAAVARGCACLGFSQELFMFALAVFEELGLVAYRDGMLTLVAGKKTDLNDSVIFTGAQRRPKGE